MSEKRKVRKFTAEAKAAILRKHLVDKQAVSDICDEYRIQPSVFYSWQRQAMENIQAALVSPAKQQKANGRQSELARQNDQLQAKLVQKDHVIAEISQEYVALKKSLGES